MGSMTGRLYEKIAWEQGCSVLDKVVLTDSSATWSSSLGEVFINACECQNMRHVTAGLQAPRECTRMHEHILHGHLGLPFSGKYDSIDCSCINGQMFSVNNLRLKITVIRFYFIVKISSYKENVWKYFTQIILWWKFFHIGWLPATHKHFPNCCCPYILVYVVASNTTSHLLFTGHLFGMWCNLLN